MNPQPHSESEIGVVLQEREDPQERKIRLAEFKAFLHELLRRNGNSPEAFWQYFEPLRARMVSKYQSYQLEKSVFWNILQNRSATGVDLDLPEGEVEAFIKEQESKRKITELKTRVDRLKDFLGGTEEYEEIVVASFKEEMSKEGMGKKKHPQAILDQSVYYNIVCLQPETDSMTDSLWEDVKGFIDHVESTVGYK